jgi:hypothetical protein
MQHNPQTKLQCPVIVRIDHHHQYRATDLHFGIGDAALLLVPHLIFVTPWGIFKPRHSHSHPSPTTMTADQLPLLAISQYYLVHPRDWHFQDVRLILQPHQHHPLVLYSETYTNLRTVRFFWAAKHQNGTWEDLSYI